MKWMDICVGNEEKIVQVNLLLTEIKWIKVDWINKIWLDVDMFVNYICFLFERKMVIEQRWNDRDLFP